MSVFPYGNYESPPNRINVLTDEAIEWQQVKQNLVFTNHVTEGWGLNLLSSHSWCNVLGCVYAYTVLSHQNARENAFCKFPMLFITTRGGESTIQVNTTAFA